MRYSFYAYPWNLLSPSEPLAQLKALGVNGITLAASYHAGKFLQPGAPRQRVYFPEDGTVYFMPQATYGRLKPLVAAVTHETDTLRTLTRNEDVSVNAWVVLNHNTRLGQLHPDLTVQNAFGNHYPYSLCPSHPEVRAYGVTLCRDLAANYAVKKLCLESPGYLTYAHGFHHEFALVRPNGWLDALLGLCFCRGCQAMGRAAGIDVQGLGQRVATAVDAYLASGEDLGDDDAQARLAVWNADADLSAFHRLRASLTTSFVAEIRAEVRREVGVKVISTCQRPHSSTYLEGGDLMALDQASDGLELPLYQPTPQGVLEDAAYVLSKVPAARTSAILRPSWPDLSSADDVLLALKGLKSQGIEDFAFYNLAMLRPQNLQWVARAIAALN